MVKGIEYEALDRALDAAFKACDLVLYEWDKIDTSFDIELQGAFDEAVDRLLTLQSVLIRRMNV